MNILEQMEVAPYEFDLRAVPGAPVLCAGDSGKFPALSVVNTSVNDIEKLYWQWLICRTDHHDLPFVRVQRLVAELKSGEQLELQRLVVPVGLETAMPQYPGRCAACRGEIPAGNAVNIGGLPYHRGCVR